MSIKSKTLWYVYELVDPRTGVAFYVGKGKGDRMHQHEKDAAKATGVCSKKINKIKELWAQGFEIFKRVNAQFWDEQAAYDHETDLIDEYGLENLTNILPGGQKAWAKRKKEREARLDKPMDMRKFLESTDEKLFAMFRQWFLWGMHESDKQVRIDVVDSKNKDLKLHAQFAEACYNFVLPMLLGEIKKSEALFNKFVERMKRHHVHIYANGCA